MMFFSSTFFVLLLFAILGLISKNTTLSISVVCLFFLSFIYPNLLFPWVEKYALKAGILILTIAVLEPIASGKINVRDIFNSFTHWQSILGILIGVFVSWLGGRGVSLMSHQPSVVTGLLVGTILGVAFFKGVPVGPLIAAGLLSLALGKF
ncbi:DUF441 domain-containing protein [Candidatus Williamhamiltonella defendens]|uniref:DUF441 domain-containing protein n=1 Tax=Candidatus Williamhamiltonella defendens TaxID=138072 RepID=UPI00130D76FA|nr:DUF441 domain-containing protein [Candidatus Hamiltonella defensa]